MPGLTRATIRAGCDASSFEHGERYQREGRITELHDAETPHGIAVSGTVTGRMPYEVYISLESGRDGPIIESDCTCEMGSDCKHAVALLLEYVERGASAPVGPLGNGSEALLRRKAESVETAVPAPDVWPPHVRDRLLFVLDVVVAHDGPSRLRVALAGARAFLDGGGYGPSAPVPLRRVLDDYRPAYVLRSDVELVRSLVTSGEIADEDAVMLGRDVAAAILESLLGTRRCHWRIVEARPLALGPMRAVRPRWRLADDGMQEIDWRFARRPDLVLPFAPPWYLDLERGECGPVESGLAAELAARLAGAPRIAPEEVDAVARELAELAPELPRPTPVEVVDLPAVRPMPCLALLAETFGGDGRSGDRTDDVGHRRQPADAPLSARARLRFRYDAFIVEAGDEREALARVRDGRVERLARDRDAEAMALKRLRAARLVELPPTAGSERVRHGDRPAAPEPISNRSVDLVPAERDAVTGWVRFLTRARPVLEAEGWAVTVAAHFPFRVVGDEGWYADIRAESGRSSGRDPIGDTFRLDAGGRRGAASGDWFSVDLGVVVDGERLPLLPLLKGWLREAGGLRAGLNALEPGDAVEVALPDGRHLVLPAERVGAILGTLVELYDADAALDGARLALPRWRAIALEASDGIEWRGAEDLRAAAARLRDAGGLASVPVPAGLAAELRGYQRVGLDWLQCLRAHGLAGVLADDMGLGKTVQVLAHLLLEKESGRADRPSLVIAPTSLLTNWRREAAAFAPQLRVVTWHGPERRAVLEREGLDAFDLVLTTYTLLARDGDVLAAQPFHLAVLDEAQYVKNARTHAARSARELNARHRLCLTGTPLENHLGEAWSLFDFLLPGLLGTERQFKRLFRVPIEKDGNADRRRALQRRVAPFLLRRRKSDVLTELPPKTEILRTVELEGDQRDLYESIRLAMHREVRDAIAAQGLDRSRIVVLDALLKLRQVCCDPRLVELEQAHRVRESAKLDLLMTLLPGMIEEGRRVLLFSQFTSMLALIEAAVRESGLEYVKLTGQTRDRAEPVDRFQRGDVPLFLISLKAGGTGLNLTAADTVIHYDPWWNPAVEAQATDRAHRIGQHLPVFVYKLVVQGTVEERILALQEGKRALAEGLFGNGGGAVALSPDDIEALLAPLE